VISVIFSLQEDCNAIATPLQNHWKKATNARISQSAFIQQTTKFGFAMQSSKTSKNGFDRVVSDESGIHPYIGSLH
jgi:hypothetical protein